MTTHPSALDRDTRRNTLLDFAYRQYPTDVERSLAATLLRIEFGEIDQAHAKAERAARDARDGRNRVKALEGRLDLGTERLRRARGQRDEARQQLADLNAAYGADLRSVERERDDARDAYDRAERELAAAKAEAEGLAETMRNTDRLTTEDRERTRRSLAEARRLRDEACGALDAQQLALSQALGLGTSAPWDAITERAREVHALTETAGTAVSASDVLERHDVTRKAMCDALGVGYHLNWQQIIDAAQRSHNANAEWQREAEQRCHALAEALDVHPSRDWGNLINTAEDVRRGRSAAVRRAETAERDARTDVAAARQAEELAGRTLAMRHQRLAEALHCDLGTSWRDLIQLAGDRTDIAAAMRQTVTRAEQNAAAARQGEAEAVRARRSAEERARTVEQRHGETETQRAAALRLLRETETQLGEARRRARNSADEVKAVKKALGAELDRAEAYRQSTEAAVARVRKATAALTPLAARHIEAAIAEPAGDLAAFTAPVSPRGNSNATHEHPVYELITSLKSEGALADAAARDLIGRYYRAITSGPPLDPAERPIKVTVRAELTPEQVAKAVRKAARAAQAARR